MLFVSNLSVALIYIQLSKQFPVRMCSICLTLLPCIPKSENTVIWSWKSIADMFKKKKKKMMSVCVINMLVMPCCDETCQGWPSQSGNKLVRQGDN